MRVFISWSGETSKLCAETLRDWLPFMNQNIDPFVSSQDISKGERGLDKVASKLQDSTFGIVCVTRENQHAPWINFESGALSRELGDSMLAPFLLDLEVKDLSGPVAQFQATESTSREEVWSLVKSLNEKCETVIEADRLRITFDRFWGDIEDRLNAIRDSRPPSPIPQRDTSEILNELVALVREQSSRISSLDKRFSRFEGDGNAPRYVINEPAEVTINPNVEIGDSVVHTMRRLVIAIVGPENVIGSRIRSGENPELEVDVNEEGFAFARANVGQLQSTASKASVGTIIRNPRGNTVALAPF